MRFSANPSLVALLAALVLTAPALAQDAEALVRRCAELASSPADEQRPEGVVGVTRWELDAPSAIAACEAAILAAPDDAGTAFNLGRALAVDHAEADLPRMAALFKQAADSGHIVGLINYGLALETGMGVPTDYAAAMDYYRRAADAGYAVGAYNLALMLANGRGVTQDHAGAARWYQVAVDGGDSSAMIDLGQLYEDGLGVPRDYAKARALYEQAAAIGDAGALTNLGWLADRGLGGFPLDHVQANDYYRRAVEAGEPQGMNNLGESLLRGEGIAMDEAAGLALVERAYDAGNDMAAHNLALYHSAGLHVRADPAKAAHYYLEAIVRDSDEAKIDLFDHAGADLPSLVLTALYAEMNRRGLEFTPMAGRLSETAIAALKGTIEP